MKKFILLLVPTLALANGPKYSYPSPRGLDDEMHNIYSDIQTVSNSMKVVQISSSSDLSSFATTSNSFQTTGLSATITPKSASDSILVIANGQLDAVTQNVGYYATLSRNGTNLIGATGQEHIITTTGGRLRVGVPIVWVDSPATTSATTYAIQIRNDDNSSTVALDNVSSGTIILMEIRP